MILNFLGRLFLFAYFYGGREGGVPLVKSWRRRFNGPYSKDRLGLFTGMHNGKIFIPSYQCCGAETFCFRSGSDISFISTFCHRFHIKKWIIHVFYERNQPNSHAGSYTIWIFIFYLLLKLTRSREPEPNLRYSGSGKKFRLLAAPAPQHCELQLKTVLVSQAVKRKILLFKIVKITYLKTEKHIVMSFAETVEFCRMQQWVGSVRICNNGFAINLATHIRIRKPPTISTVT